MKRILALFTIAIVAATAVAADGDAMKWSERMLKWSDFQGSSVIDGKDSYMKTSLDIESFQKQEDGNTIIKLGAVAKMFRSGSFATADSTCRTRQRLRYHQLQFDLLEVMRRRLQNDLNSGMTGIDADNRLKYYRHLYAEQLAAIDDETDNGRNDHKLQEWEYFTRKNLEEMGLPHVPAVTPSDVSYGLFIGLG